MADSSIFGKVLMGQRPKAKSEESERLDDLDFYMRPGYEQLNKTMENGSGMDVNVDLSDNPEMQMEIESDFISADDVEVIHSHNIDDEGNVKEFSIHDPELPEDLEVGTSTAAKALGVTEQTIRNYCNDFSEFLEVRIKKNGRRKLSIKTLRKLNNIMQIKEERKYDREQMRAYLRNEGKESLMVTEAERMQALADAVSKKVIDELYDFFSGDNGIFPRIDAQSKQMGLMDQNIQKSLVLLSEKENNIKELVEMLSSEKQTERLANENRISELEEKLDIIQREFAKASDIVKQKDELIVKLQQDNDLLKEAASKKKWWFHRK